MGWRRPPPPPFAKARNASSSRAHTNHFGGALGSRGALGLRVRRKPRPNDRRWGGVKEVVHSSAPFSGVCSPWVPFQMPLPDSYDRVP